MVDLVFVGFNRQVIALDRYSGEVIWTWKAPKGSGYVAILIDGDRLIVAVNGYMYCLDPLFGQEAWSNPLTGMGMGVPCLASIRGLSQSHSQAISGAAAAIAQQRAAAAATGAGGAGAAGVV